MRFSSGTVLDWRVRLLCISWDSDSNSNCWISPTTCSTSTTSKRKPAYLHRRFGMPMFDFVARSRRSPRSLAIRLPFGVYVRIHQTW